MTRPNIILIISDQLRRQALGVYGDPNVSTPHIDALAARGTRFTQASSTYPVCVPYRFSLMTGEYAHTRVDPVDRVADVPGRTHPGRRVQRGGLPHRVVREVAPVRRASATCRGTPSSRRRVLRCRGRSRAGSSASPGSTSATTRTTRYYVNEDDPTLHKIDGFQTDGLFDLAIEHLRSPERADAPFATVLSVEPPHPLFTAPPEYLDRWRDRDVVLRDNVELGKDYKQRGPHGRSLLDDLRVYYAMIENLDDNVGRLVETLRAEGMLDNTIIGLTADHGELLGCHGLLAKQRPWEESIGIPLILSGPGTAARAVDNPVCTEDLFPTLLGLAGITPRDPKPGEDLTPLIRGDADGFGPRRRAVGVRRRVPPQHRLPRGDLARPAHQTLQVHRSR